jgi:hypothetical protein
MDDAKIKKLLADLQESHAVHLNRQLALEAMFDAILTRVDPKVLPVISEAYEAARDRLAAKLHPLIQRPEHWDQWTQRLEELQRQVQDSGSSR